MSDAIAYKKKVLFPHLDFVNFMLNKSLGTKFESLWKHVHNCITNDKKKMTSDQISKIQRTVVTNKKRFPTWNKKLQKLREMQTHQPIPHQEPSSSAALENNHVTMETTTTIYQCTRYSEDFSRDPRRRAIKSTPEILTHHEDAIACNKSLVDSIERTNALYHRNSSLSPQPSRERIYKSRSRSRGPDYRRSDKYFEDKSYYNEHYAKEKRRSRSFSPIHQQHQRRTRSKSPFSRRNYDQKTSYRSKSPRDQHYSSRRNARGENGLSSHSSKKVYHRKEYDKTKYGHPGDSSSFSREREHSLKSNHNRDSREKERFQSRTVSFSPPEEDQRSYQRNNSNCKQRNVDLSSHSSRHHEHTRSPKDEASHLIPPGCEEPQEYKSNRQGYHSKDLPRAIKNYDRNPKRQHDEYYQGTSVVHTHRLSVHERLGAPNRTDRNESFTFQKRNSNLNISTSATVTSEQHSKLKRSIDQKTIREEEQTNSEEFNPRFEEPKEKRLKILCEESLETISSESEKSEKVALSPSVIKKVKNFNNPQDIAETLIETLGYEGYMKFKSFINTEDKVGEKKSEEIVRKDEKEKQSKQDVKEEESEEVIQKKAIDEKKSDALVNKTESLKKESKENAIKEKKSNEIVKGVKKQPMFVGKIPKKIVVDQTETTSPRAGIQLPKAKSNSLTARKSTSSKFQRKIEVDVAKSNNEKLLTARKSTSSKFQSKLQVDVAKGSTKKLSKPEPKKEPMSKKSTKPKRNELDRLHDSINEMYDKEGIAHSGGPRTCTLHKSGKLIDVELSEENMEERVEKFKLKPFKVVLDRVNLPEGQTRVAIDEKLLEMNPNLEKVLAPYLDEANDDATGDDLDLSLDVLQSPKESIQKLHSEPSPKNRVLVNTSPPVKKRSKWSKGILKTKKRIRRRFVRLADEWEDIESPKKKDQTGQLKLQLKQVVDFMCVLEKKAMPTKTKKSNKNPCVDDCVSSLTVEGENVSELIKVPESTANERISIGSLELPKELPKRPTLKVIIHPGDKLSTVKPSSTISIEKPPISLPVPGAIALKPLIGKVIPHCRITIKNQPKTSNDLRVNKLINNSSTALASTTASTMLQSCTTDAPKNESCTTDALENESTKSNTIVIRDVLRPWITDGTNKKNSLSSLKMLGDRKCLAALYKCMGSTCSYFTSKESLFKIHLEVHSLEYEANDDNYLICSYCDFKANEIAKLLAHIDTKHSYDKFQCGYCFFRGLNDFQVFLQHRQNHHPTLSKVLIECENYKVRQYDVKTLKNLINKNVPSLQCFLCDSTFYVFKLFMDHLNSHEEEPADIKCDVCADILSKKNIMAHFHKCRGYGLFECIYCKFASGEVTKLDDHIAEKHFSERPLFCVRKLPATGSEKMDVSSIESMITQKINKKGTCTRVRVAPADLINESKVLLTGAKKLYTKKEDPTTIEEPIQFIFSNGKLSRPEAQGLKIHNVKPLSSKTQTIEILDSD